MLLKIIKDLKELQLCGSHLLVLTLLEIKTEKF